MNASIIRTRLALVAVCALAFAACSSPPSGTSTRDGGDHGREQRSGAAPGEPADSSAPATGPVADNRAGAAPPSSDPQPAGRMPAPAVIDYSCRVDADCTVKNVGSCCGMMPACVNASSPTDPAAVQAECERSGISSVCGFAEITACGCVNSRCTAEQAPVGSWIDGDPARAGATR
jgi:hypothetical protein